MNRYLFGSHAKLIIYFFGVLVIVLTLIFAAKHFPQHSQSQILYGEWNPAWQTGGSVYNGVINSRETEIGRPLNIIHWYAAADEGYASYEHIMVDNALRLKKTPLISWGLPIDFKNNSLIDDWAQGIKAKAPHDIYIRLFWEFNDPLTDTNQAWSVCNSRYKPSDLVSSWIYIVNRFKTDGVTNVKWVWNADGTLGPNQMYGDSCGSISQAYPGDQYVDYRGFDDYSYDTQAQYKYMNTQTKSNMPIILGEIGANDNSGGSNWVNNLNQQLNQSKMKEVKAIIWFNQGESQISPIKNKTTFQAVQNMLRSPAFKSQLK